MYKEVTYRYDKYIQSNMQKVINIYFDDVLVDPTYITEFKKGGTLFNKQLELGSTPSQYIELKIHKRANIPIPNQIRVEFGVLVNNALTLYEVNKMLLGELNVTPIRSLAKRNYDFEIIPIGIFNVDDYSYKDSNLITIKASDNIIKLENDDGYYDMSSILKEDTNKQKYATLGEIAEDICKKKGLELGSKSFLNSNKKMYVYDNSITAREYIGYIAEAAGCFACSGRDGKIYFKSIGEDMIAISQNLFKTYKYGEQYKISMVAYENGIESFKFGTATNNTLWLSQDNIFITEENEVNSIYNKVKDLTVYSFEGTVVIDPRVDIGDIIIVDGKKIIYQGEITFGGRTRANIKSKISMKARSETTVRRPSQKTINRKVQSKIDEAEGKITQLVEEQTDTSKKLTKVEQTVSGITSSVSTVTEETKTVKDKVDNLAFGGTNILRGTNVVEKLTNSGIWSTGTWRSASGGTGTRESITVTDSPNSNIKLGWHISSTNSQITICQDDVPTTNGEEYVLSCYAKGTGKIYLQYGSATLGYQNTQLDVTNTWKKYKFKFKSKGKANAYFGVNVTNYDIQICGMKLEKGNIDTDWSPAPEDIESNLVTNYYTKTATDSQIKQLSESITNTVETQITTVTNVANSANNTASNSVNKAQEALDKANNAEKELGEYKNDTKRTITEIKKTAETSLTDSKYAIEVAEGIVENGIEKLDTKTGFTFDSEGLKIEKTGAETKSKLNEVGLDIQDNTGRTQESLLFAGYDKTLGETIVKSKNMTVEKYLCIGKNSRMEDYQGGTAIFCTGGE